MAPTAIAAMWSPFEFRNFRNFQKVAGMSAQPTQGAWHHMPTAQKSAIPCGYPMAGDYLHLEQSKCARWASQRSRMPHLVSLIRLKPFRKLLKSIEYSRNATETINVTRGLSFPSFHLKCAHKPLLSSGNSPGSPGKPWELNWYGS